MIHRPGPVALTLACAMACLCAPALAQHAALSCFEPEVMRIYEQRRLSFKERRDYLLPAFAELGLIVPAAPDGAFYIFADIRNFGLDGAGFCRRLLNDAHVAAVPGLDFGEALARHTVRFSYATGLDRLKEAVQRMAVFLGGLRHDHVATTDPA